MGIHLTVGTVEKYLTSLVGRGLITMEHSRYFDKRGIKWKGNNLYTIPPTQAAVDQFHQLQLHHGHIHPCDRADAAGRGG